jgi:hypothetical protein
MTCCASSSSSCSCIQKYQTKEEERLDDDVFVYTPHYIGNHILLCGKKSSQFPYQLMIGPDWPCMVLTYVLILTPTFFFLWDVGNVLGWWIYLVGGSTGFMTLLYFSLTACTDPGIVFLKALSSQQRIEALAKDKYLNDLEKGSVITTARADENTADLAVSTLDSHDSNFRTTCELNGDDSVDKSNVNISLDNEPTLSQQQRIGTSAVDQDTTFNSDENSLDIEAGVRVPDGNSTAPSTATPAATGAASSVPKLANGGENSARSINSASNHLIECGTCAMKRPTSASHCYDCGLCIDEVDHHCPVSQHV